MPMYDFQCPVHPEALEEHFIAETVPVGGTHKDVPRCEMPTARGGRCPRKLRRLPTFAGSSPFFQEYTCNRSKWPRDDPAAGRKHETPEARMAYLHEQKRKYAAEGRGYFWDV